MTTAVRIGITAGDLNGIGPEVAVKALLQIARKKNDVEFVLIGSIPAWQSVPGWPTLSNKKHYPKIYLWDPDPALKLRPAPGKIRADASRAAALYIRSATEACLKGYLDAIVTAPITKEGFKKAGVDFPGHTEMLAKLTRTRNFAMMLVGGSLRVVLATRHIPIAKVPRAITPTLIKQQASLTSQGLDWLGIKRRRIAICGLNPHAGEGGKVGTEDARIIAPTVNALKKSGLDVAGPLPGDTVFHHAAAGKYGAVLAMYHDQGLAPLKLIAFDRGVNITLGLPIVRTSPDHGTAFDIAGKNKANPSSMIHAVELAIRLARRKNPWKKNG